MNIFKWEANYETGIKKIDDQHKQLVDTLNQMYNQTLMATSESSTKDILLSLFDYISEHFRTEEEFMLETNFKHYKTHREKHIQFEEHIRKYMEDVENGFSVSLELITLLKDWLQDHILGLDSKLSKAKKDIIRRDTTIYLT